MDMNQYQIFASRTLKNLDNDMLEECAWALAEEPGELIGLIKKHLKHGHPVTEEFREKVMNELGDNLFYISAVALLYNIPLEDVGTYNIKKLQRRFPNGFSSADSVARRDVRE